MNFATRVDYKVTPALQTVAFYMYGDRDKWLDVANGINAAATNQEIFAAVLQTAANDTLTIDGEWEDTFDMVKATVNNILYDMGMATGDVNAFIGMK